MDGAELQDRFSRGMGAAARALGMPNDLFRPDSADAPMLAERRVLRLYAAFDLGDPGYRRPRGYEHALRGTFDADWTRVGDYMRGPRGVLFIALLPPLQRPLCVLTNGLFDVLRAAGPGVPGLNAYGGVQEPGLVPVLRGWPGSILSGGGDKPGALPVDGGQSGWSVLLPPTPALILGSDLLRERDGRRFIVRSAERSDLGWRLSVRAVGV